MKTTSKQRSLAGAKHTRHSGRRIVTRKDRSTVNRVSKWLNMTCITGCAIVIAGCSWVPKSLTSWSPNSVVMNFSPPSMTFGQKTSACKPYRRPVTQAFFQWSFFKPSKVVKVPKHVAPSLIQASKVTGIDADYLALTAARESSFRTSANARTSSAQGLFQFVEQTWLRILATDGHCHGLEHLTRHIYKQKNGRYAVRSGTMRRRILNLRKDPTISSFMAARLTQRNAEAFKRTLGRAPSNGELYVAHFLGATSAAKLAKLSRKSPRSRADQHFKAAARANPRIFYTNRRGRSVREVYNDLVKRHSKVRVVFPGTRSA